MIEQLQIIAYKLSRRFFTVNVSRFMTVNIGRIIQHQTTHELSIFDSTEALTERFPSILDTHPEWCSRLKLGNVKLCCAIENGKIVGRLWSIANRVPPELNHDGPDATRLPLELPYDMVFVFDVCVDPDHRGKRIYPAMFYHASNHLFETDEIRQFLITVDFANRPAKRAADRKGFREVGRSSLIRLGPFSFARYPDAKLSPVKIGRYFGDLNLNRPQLAYESGDSSPVSQFDSQEHTSFERLNGA